MLAIYKGNNIHLRTKIEELEHAYIILINATVRRAIILKAITPVESMLFGVIFQSLHGNNDEKRWLAANRIEINVMFKEFNGIRKKFNIPRDHKINDDFEKLQQLFADPNYLVDNKETLDNAIKLTRKRYGGATAGAVIAATGFSAASFIAGPVIGGAVTGGTAIISSAGAAILTEYKIHKTKKKIPERLEKSLRAEFTYR